MYDHAENANRLSFDVMEAVDRGVGRPAVHAYQKIVPQWLRTRVTLFFANLETVDSALNCYLQGNFSAGNSNLGRVLLNSTAGLAGFFDPASKIGLQYHNEDFGQTLATWGYTRSRYIYVPVIGPSTIRDLPGDVFHRIISPRLLLGSPYTFSTGAAHTLSYRSDLLVLSDARDSIALDSYAFTREAFFQKRKFDIYNGEIPFDESMFDDFDEE